MRRSRNWWGAVLVPVLVIGGVELLADWILDPYLPFPLDTLVVTATILLLALVLVSIAGRRIAILSGTLEARSRELERRGATARSLHQLGVTVAATRDLQAVQQVVVASTRRLLEADIAFVITQGHDRTQVAAHDGPADAFVTPAEFGSHEPAELLAEPYRHSVVAAPLLRGASTTGALVVAGRRERTFSVDELETLSSLANLLALAIENARLEAQLRELAVRGERERIAREMHDGLAQVLGYVNTKSQAVEQLLSRRRIGEARSQLSELAAAARSIYVDVREAILGLSSPVTAERGLVGAVEEYAARFGDTAKIAVSVAATPEAVAVELTPEMEAQAFRIIQEALTNIRKHARAGKVSIALGLAERCLEVTVTDDGRGFASDGTADGVAPPGADDAASHWPRYGLSAMRERAASIGGELSIASQTGRGTSVVLRLPAVEMGARVS